MTVTFGSLFAGIGGFDLGFERAGMECRWQVEIDPHCRKVLAKHWPDTVRFNDVCEFPPPFRHRREWEVDVVCGGFPCQDISYAGLGAGLSGSRSGLFYELMRIVGVLGPRVVVLENVAALLTRGMDQVLGTLASFGYDVEWHCVQAADFGAPHIRDRLFIISHPQRLGCRKRRSWGTAGAGEGQEDPSVLADPEYDGIPERGGTGDAPLDGGQSGRVQRNDRQGVNPPEEAIRPEGYSIWRSSFWKTEPDVGRVADGVPARMDRLRGLGNAIVPQVSEWVGRRVMEVLE